MNMAKRMMAMLLCLALLLSGFALANAPVDPAQEQEQIQDETNLEAEEGRHSEMAAASGDEDDAIDADGEAGASASDLASSDPAIDQNDSEQDADGDASDVDAGEPETPDGEASSETPEEPGAANEETDEDGAAVETGETEDANADVDPASIDQDVEMDALNDSKCPHVNEQEMTQWDEPTGKIESLQEEGHRIYFIHHWKITCLDCGEVLDSGEEESSKIFDHNLDADSNGVFKCEACGYSFQCEHPAEYVTTETEIEPYSDSGDYVVASDENGHTIKARKWEQYHCEKCDVRWGRHIAEDSATITEAHEWDEKNGGKACRKCGWKNTCAHKNVENVDEWDDVVRATKINGDTHSAVYVRYANVKCKDCGWIVKHDAEIERWKQTDDHSFIERSDGTIACSACGYVIPCTHPYVEFLVNEDVGWKEPEQVNAQQHRVRRYDQTYYRCRDCGHEWGWEYPDDDSVEVVLENHQWNDEGVCKICGYKNECTQHNFQPVANGMSWDGTIDYKYLDAATHQVTIGLFQELACTKCGFTIVDHIDDSTNQTYVEDHYWSSEGYCEVCGAKGFCQHPAAYVEKLTGTVSRDDLEPISSNEKTHTMYADSYVEYHCKRCDTWWGYEVTKYGIEQTEPHLWDSNGASWCVTCGYKNPCTHEGTTENYREENFRPIPSKTTATTHSVNPYVIMGKHCTKCDAYFESTATGDTGAIVTEPHKFVRKGGKSVCKVCGYIKTEKKDENSDEETESSEEKTGEGAFEEIAGGTEVHGVTVGQPTCMGVTMAQAMAGIAAEYGADATIEIQNIDKVLTADECAALNALQPAERILVALSAIGYGDEVEDAIAELQLTLSEEAQALSQQVDARVAQMEDDAKAEHQKAIEEYFSISNGAAITLEIRKAGESSVRKERYSFTQSNGEWAFAKLEVANG